MDYNSSGEFIPKLELERFYIGSFDVYEKEAKQIAYAYVGNHSKKYDSVDELFASLPTAYRGSIVEKRTNEYLGFISAMDIDEQKSYASIIIGLANKQKRIDIFDIIDGYIDFLEQDLGIANITKIVTINDEKMKVGYNSVIYRDPGLTSLYLFEDTEKTNLKFPVKVIFRNYLIARIGLESLLWSNKRATMKIELDESANDELAEQILPTAINHYLTYLHDNNLCNINTEIPANNKVVLDSVLKSDMNLYGYLPYGAEYNGYLETSYLFEHYPNMEKVNLNCLPRNKRIKVDDLEPINLTKSIKIDDEYTAISPKAFKEYSISLEKMVKGHIKALQNRDTFSIPLDQDKYFIQEGNGNYGISKLVSNFTYVLVNNNLEYCGYVNILRQQSRHAVIEIAIKPSLQNKGIGTKLLDKFIRELLSDGYYGVSSYVFEFNKGSNKIHQKLTKFCGKRSKAYYINGKFWDMNLYAIEK